MSRTEEIEASRDGAIREAVLRDENGDVAREDPHALPLRGDGQSLHVETESMIGFEPVALRSDGVRV